jgi:hypothetical protein
MSKYRLHHSPIYLRISTNTRCNISTEATHLCCICCGGSISTKVGLFLAAALPPALISGKPGRCRSYSSATIQISVQITLWHRARYYPTLDSRLSVKTLQTSLCLTTSHAWLPSQSVTLETGSVARRVAYSVGGSAPDGRLNGNCGGSNIPSTYKC